MYHARNYDKHGLLVYFVDIHTLEVVLELLQMVLYLLTRRGDGPLSLHFFLFSLLPSPLFSLEPRTGLAVCQSLSLLSTNPISN